MTPSRQTVSNFGKNVEFQPPHNYQPASADEVLEILREHKGKTIRVGGTLHAWSEGIQTTDVYIDTSKLDSIEIKTERNKPYVLVGGGCKIKHLLEELAQSELTLPSVGLIDAQSVAGATATGTHGSGKQSLSHFVSAVRLAHYDASGQPVLTEVSSGDELKAARCSMGLMGVVVAVKFQCRKAYNIKEHLEKYDTLKQVLNSESRFPLQQFFLMPWSWSFYAQHRVESNEEKSRSIFWYALYWKLFIDRGLHLVVFLLVKILGIKALIRSFYKRILPFTLAKNWKVVDDSHPILTMEHDLFRHIEIEVFVTRDKLGNALNFVTDVISVFGGLPIKSGNQVRAKEMESFAGNYMHHYPICVRRVLSDDTLISMASPMGAESNEDWYAISLISYDWPKNRDGFHQFADFVGSQIAEKFNGRVHWGKYNPFTQAQNIAAYPRLGLFMEICDEFDSQKQFRNDWLEKVLPSTDLTSQQQLDLANHAD